MAMVGWIKLHRGLADHVIAGDPQAFSVWVHLLLMANHRETKRMINGQIVVLAPGQLITSRRSISEKTGVQESKVERILKLLKTEQQIEQVGTAKFRVISIVNWGLYQSDEQVDEQQMNSRRTADEQQMNTPEEIQEWEECKEKSSPPSVEYATPKKTRAPRKAKIPTPFLVTGEMRTWAAESVPGVDLKTETEKFVDYWRGEATTKADWTATWRNWMRKAQQDHNRPGPRGGAFVNRQQQIEEENARVVREITEREARRKREELGQEPMDLGDVVAVDGEVIHVD